MKVLVTGMEGFTGSYLRNTLEGRGHTVTGLASDLCDRRGVAEELADIRPDHVVHLAALAHAVNMDAESYYQVNLLGTLHLLQGLEPFADSVQEVILASSAHVYDARGGGVLDERTPFRPTNDYGASKLAMEHMARLRMDHLPITIVRPFNYTGVGQSADFIIPKIVSHFRDRSPVIELGNIHVRREFGDVRTVAEIYARLLEKKPAGKTVNLCTGQAHALENILDLCRELTGHDMEVRVNQAFVRRNDPELIQGDPGLLGRLIGDLPATDMKDLLRWMLMD